MYSVDKTAGEAKIFCDACEHCRWYDGDTKNNNGHDDTMIIGISIRPFMYPNTMFLTEKEAREHLERNHYHYSEDAHTYCMVAWRSPEVEKLWKILRETKWD